MFDIYYENSQGIKISLVKAPYRLQTGDLFNYRWDYTTSISRKFGGKIKSFRRDVKTITLLLGIMGDSAHAYHESLNKFSEITEYDINLMKPGKLWCGKYYISCYLVSSEKGEWESDIEVLDNTIELVAEYPFWINENEYNFKQSRITSTDNKRYAYKYAYRYANGLSSTDLVNVHYTECNFLMRIYGPITKPLVIIGGYRYFVDIVLEEGEYLEIDSVNETVTKVMTSGIRINSFHNRSKQDSVFRPIQTGRQQVSWSGKFDFDVILYQERSEPEWL